MAWHGGTRMRVLILGAISRCYSSRLKRASIGTGGLSLFDDKAIRNKL